MDFRLGEEQLELQDTVRRRCTDRLRHEDLARVAATGASTATPGARWPTSACSPCSWAASAGGPGCGAVGGAIVFEQLGDIGRRLAWSHLLHQYGRRARDLSERQMLAAAQHRSDETILDRDGDTDVDVVVVDDAAV